MMRRISRIALVAMLLAGACAERNEQTAGDTASAGAPAPAPPAAPPAAAPEAPGTGSPTATPPAPRALAPLAKDAEGHEGAPRWSRAISGPGTELARDVAVSAQGHVAVAGYFEGGVDFGDGAPREANEIDAFVSVYGKDGALLYSLQFGGDGEDAAHAVAFDPAGNAVIAGLFTGSVSIGEIRLEGAGSDDAFIAKLDPQGKPLWARALGGRDSDAANDVAVDADGSIHVTGSFLGDLPVDGTTKLRSKGNEDVFLVELGPDGDLVRSQAFGHRYRDIGQRVAVDAAGNVILLAEFTDEVSFGGPALVSEGNRDLAAVKLGPAGDHLWSRRFGSPFNEYGLGLSVDPAGNIALTGSFDNEIDFGGGKLASAGESDVFVARLGPDGAHLWSRRFGSAREDIGHGIASDRYGNVVLTGWFWSEVDFGGGPLRADGMNKDGFLLKLSADGKHLWSRRFGAKDHDQGRGVAMTAEGEAALIGIFRFRLDLGGNALESARAPEDKAPPPDVVIAAFGR